MSRETGFAYTVIASALFLAAVFHFLVFDYPFGWPWAVFLSLGVLFLVVVRRFQPAPQNRWAYLFLGPLFLGLLADVLYSNNIVQLHGQLLTLLSLAFFSYWLYSPKIRLADVISFWPATWIMETLIPLEGAGPLSKISINQHGRQAAFGVLIAVPFVLIFLGLFLSADALIGKVLRNVIHLDDPQKLIAQIVFDFLIGFYLLRAFWQNVTRTLHERHPRWRTYTPSEASVLYASFLSVLNLLFLGFIGFQFVYFFGGQGIVESYGLTYASYAREGFFQLFTVSVIVFAIVYGVGFLTRWKSLVVRLLSLALIVQSWIVIASAMKRLTLYIDAYGLSVLRWWAFAGLIVAAVALLVLAAWIVARGSFEAMTKTLALGSLYVFAGLLLFNHESFIVSWNASRGASELVAPDFLYPLQLSSDAIPAYVDWLKGQSPDTPISCLKLQGSAEKMILLATDDASVAQGLVQRYRDANGGRTVIEIQPATQLQRGYDERAYYVLRPRSLIADCRMSDLTQVMLIFYLEALKGVLKDPRQWTWSDARALKALSS